jgi:hypothetical protein
MCGGSIMVVYKELELGMSGQVYWKSRKRISKVKLIFRGNIRKMSDGIRLALNQQILL